MSIIKKTDMIDEMQQAVIDIISFNCARLYFNLLILIICSSLFYYHFGIVFYLFFFSHGSHSFIIIRFC